MEFMVLRVSLDLAGNGMIGTLQNIFDKFVGW